MRNRSKQFRVRENRMVKDKAYCAATQSQNRDR